MSHPPIPSRHIVTTPRRRHDMSKVTDPFAASPQLMKQWMAVSLAAQDSLEPSLIELVKVRSSILNGCANCINMHTAEARAKGEIGRAHVELQSLMRISYAVFCLQKQNQSTQQHNLKTIQ